MQGMRTIHVLATFLCLGLRPACAADAAAGSGDWLTISVGCSGMTAVTYRITPSTGSNVFVEVISHGRLIESGLMPFEGGFTQMVTTCLVELSRLEPRVPKPSVPENSRDRMTYWFDASKGVLRHRVTVSVNWEDGHAWVHMGNPLNRIMATLSRDRPKAYRLAFEREDLDQGTFRREYVEPKENSKEMKKGNPE